MLCSAFHGAAQFHTIGCYGPSATATLHTRATQSRAKAPCALYPQRLADGPEAHTLDVEQTPSLYLPHLDAVSESTSLLPNTAPLYGLNPRGLGESRPMKQSSFIPMAWTTSFTATRLCWAKVIWDGACDALTTIDLLLVGEARGKSILYGRGQGLIALCTALLHDRSGTVTLHNSPLSYTAWCKHPS